MKLHVVPNHRQRKGKKEGKKPSDKIECHQHTWTSEKMSNIPDHCLLVNLENDTKCNTEIKKFR